MGHDTSNDQNMTTRRKDAKETCDYYINQDIMINTKEKSAQWKKDSPRKVSARIFRIGQYEIIK